MAITPEQVKNQEFPVRLRGYDPGEVRRFLTEVAVAYRATIRDQGAQWALANISDDLAAVLRAAHDAAERVMSHAEADAADVRRRAAREAATTQAEAEVTAANVAREAHASAEQVRQEATRAAAALLADARAEADALRAEARQEAEELRSEVQAETTELQQRSQDEARARIAEVMAETQARIDELQATERALEERIRSARADVELLAQRLGAGTTIDLTGHEPAIVLDGHDSAHGHDPRAGAEAAASATPGQEPSGDDPACEELSADELTRFVRDLQLGTDGLTVSTEVIAPRAAGAGGRVDRMTVQRMVSAAVDRALAHSSS